MTPTNSRGSPGRWPRNSNQKTEKCGLAPLYLAYSRTAVNGYLDYPYPVEIRPARRLFLAQVFRGPGNSDAFQCQIWIPFWHAI